MAPATTIAPASHTAPTGGTGQTGDFVQDVALAAERIDRKLRLSLSPRQYAMVQDLVLATRIMTIARDADDELAAPSAA
ncbi:MAG: hypothetical protein IT306_21580 [Chloroflexi bacterium]|nr:hypothetical protein [Chloroflexota bacterium]